MSHPLFDDAVRLSLHTAVEPSNYRLDCFVTNELAYNDVLTRCRPTGAATTGGYVGVGPCQNLTYVGALRPRCAVIVDTRVDNVLQHLIFKLIMERKFGESRSSEELKREAAHSRELQRHATPPHHGGHPTHHTGGGHD